MERRIPGLIWAVDIVLLADTAKNLRKAAGFFGEPAAYLGLNFSPHKSGVVVFDDEANTMKVRIEQEAVQGRSINTVRSINTGTFYYIMDIIPHLFLCLS